jgi:hypothetical protein
MARFTGRTNGHGEWSDQRLLGKHFIDTQHEAVLRIGKTVFTRQEMVDRLRCGNFNAARRLTRAATELGVASAQEMAARVSLEDLFKVRDVGVTTVYVWLCLLEGMNKNPLQWLDRSEDEIVTLTTEKKRVVKAQPRKAKKRRKGRPAPPTTPASPAPAE